MRCCFTGHRVISTAERDKVQAALTEALEPLLDGGEDCRFLAGGAMGFDTIAAETVLVLRERYPRVQLTLVLPCVNQTLGWPPWAIERYERIRAQADEVIYTSKEYYDGCMLRRDRYLAENSDICIAYLRPRIARGGTRYTVDCCLNRGIPVINLAQRLILVTDDGEKNWIP